VTNETVNAVLGVTVKTLEALEEKKFSFGRKPLEKQCILPRSHTSLLSPLLRPFLEGTTESGKANGCRKNQEFARSSLSTIRSLCFPCGRVVRVLMGVTTSVRRIISHILMPHCS
jgi:hypothetical protein